MLAQLALALIAWKQPAPLAEIPFRLADSAIIVDVTINGRNASLMFDTGFAGDVVLNDALDIGPTTGATTLQDFVGLLSAPTVALKSLKVGSFSMDVTDREVVQQPMSRLTDAYGTHADGILGLAPFIPYVTQINFEKQKFIIYPRSYNLTTVQADNQKTFLEKMLPQGMNAIHMAVSIPGAKDRLVLGLDTGNAFYLTTHKDSLEKLGVWQKAREGKFSSLAGVASGSVKTFNVRAKAATIFGVPVKDGVWDVIDLPSSSATDDGTVGFEFLKNFNVTFDYRRRRVLLENFSGTAVNDAPGDLGLSAGWDGTAKRVEIFLVSPESPAALAGIKEGDTLLSIDDTDLAGAIATARLRKLLHGPVGSKATLSISHGGLYKRVVLERKLLVNDLDAPTTS